MNNNVYKLKSKKKSIQVKSEMFSGCKLLNGVSSRGELCSINFFFYLGFQLIVFQPDDSTSVTNGEVRQIEIGIH